MKFFKHDDLTEIIFEDRNKKFGAYELRKNYGNHLKKAIMVMMAAPLTLTLIFLFHENDIKIDKPNVSNDSLVVTMVELPKQIEEQKNTQPKEIQKPAASNNGSAIIIAKDSVIESKTKDTTMVATNQGSGGGSAIDTTSKPADTTQTGGGFIASTNSYQLAELDAQPEFMGGAEKMYSWLYKHVEYTARARENNVRGKIFVSFIVDGNGEIRNVKLMNSLGFGLDEEVKEAIENMPRWKAGVLKGRNVSTLLTLPVSFSLR